MKTITELLAGNTYPGRGIAIGRSADGQHGVIAYFIMGRSENSRNRIFAETDDGIQTQAFDESKMEDPSLIIYHPVRTMDDVTIVTNGDQTDTIRDGFLAGKPMPQSLKTRTFEPDGPHFTSRISGVLFHNGDYALSILKTADGDATGCNRQFFGYETPAGGTAHLIHTYQCDGNPLPAFAGEPKPIAVTAPTAADFAEEVWSALDKDNKISLYVQYRNIATGEVDTVIKNVHS
ncbi:MAG: IMP cyclohydrolase [Eubacteriales bacterium]